MAKKSSTNNMANRFLLLGLEDEAGEDQMSPVCSPTKTFGIAA